MKVSWLIGSFLVSGFILAGCWAIPVRAVRSDQAILVAPVGVQSTAEDGTTTYNPSLPQPKAEVYKPPAGVPWGTLAIALATIVGGSGGAALVGKTVATIGRLRAAAKIGFELADDMAEAEDGNDIVAAKRVAKEKQEAAGVRDLTASLRGKPIPPEGPTNARST